MPAEGQTLHTGLLKISLASCLVCLDLKAFWLIHTCAPQPMACYILWIDATRFCCHKLAASISSIILPNTNTCIQSHKSPWPTSTADVYSGQRYAQQNASQAAHFITEALCLHRLTCTMLRKKSWLPDEETSANLHHCLQ